MLIHVFYLHFLYFLRVFDTSQLGSKKINANSRRNLPHKTGRELNAKWELIRSHLS
jgi:hypothetical protein